MAVQDVGDIAWVEFYPVLGTEQGGRRPALILTSRRYHEASGRAVVCPITSNTGPWSFNVPLPAGIKTKGVVQVDQIRTVDRTARVFRKIDAVPDVFVDEVRIKLAALLGFDFAVLSGDVDNARSE
jgi:mRNA interferase MazF